MPRLRGSFRPYQQIEHIETLSPLILSAPRTGVDMVEGARLPSVPPQAVRYLLGTVKDSAWLDHLALAALLMAARRYDPRTIYSAIGHLHVRFRKISECDWTRNQHRPVMECIQDVDAWMGRYLIGELSEESANCRYDFYRFYQAVSRLSQTWLAGLAPPDQVRYRPFLFPVVNTASLSPILKNLARQELAKQPQRRRKEEVDALLPVYPQLRSEAHLRFNAFARLRQAYLDVMRRCNEDNTDYPHNFSYVDGDRRFIGRIWSAPAFKARYSKLQTIKQWPARFLEITAIEAVTTGKPLNIASELWFADLLRRVLSHPAADAPTPIARAWLAARGHTPTAFHSATGGLTYWADRRLMRLAQACTTGLLLPVDELYRALSFGLLALDLFTTTGARLNEVMQVSLDRECLVRLTMPAPAGANDPRPRVRYVLRLLPKGERKDQLHDFFIGEETKRLLARTAKMLAEHYETDERGAIPVVPFNRAHPRAHRFSPRPYVFQLQGQHLGSSDVTVCLRLLLDGLVLKTQTGRTFSVRPHLLRHAFATHAVQVEKIPLDIVGYWLHQKSIKTTAYYSQVTDTMAADAADGFLARIATNIDVGKAVVRSPRDLRQMYPEASARSGTLASVPGGACTSHGFCKAHFTCIGCPAKVPDPAKRDQVLQKVEWGRQQLQYYQSEGLSSEARQLEQMLQAADAELREMDSIERYRADAQRAPVVEATHG